MKAQITQVFGYWVKMVLPNGREVKLPRPCFDYEPVVGEFVHLQARGLEARNG